MASFGAPIHLCLMQYNNVPGLVPLGCQEDLVTVPVVQSREQGGPLTAVFLRWHAKRHRETMEKRGIMSFIRHEVDRAYTYQHRL